MAGDDNEKLFGGKNVGIRGIYKTLSGAIHSAAAHFQTRPDRVSPKYKITEFMNWMKTFKEVQRYFNILLVLGFPENFRELSSAKKRIVEEIGIESSQYQTILQKVLAS